MPLNAVLAARVLYIFGFISTFPLHVQLTVPLPTRAPSLPAPSRSCGRHLRLLLRWAPGTPLHPGTGSAGPRRCGCWQRRRALSERRARGGRLKRY